jgi:hypothetical protein
VRPARAARLAAAAFLAIAQATCFSSWGKQFASGSAEGLHQRRDSLAATADTVVRRAVYAASQAYGDSLQPRLDSTLQHINRSVGKLLTDNASSLKDSLRPTVDSLLDRAGDHLVPLAGRLADTATWHAILALDQGITKVLQPTLHGLVRDARLQAESTVRVIRAQAESTARSAAGAANKPISRLGQILWLVAGIVVAVVASGIAFIWWSYRRSQASLAVVAAAINDLGSAGSAVKESIKQRARAEKVEPWLHGFLVKRGLA